MLPILGLVVGALVAVLLQPTVPQDLSRYVAMAVVAALDATLGGVRSSLEHTFSDRIFVFSFLSNVAVAMILVWLGDQLATDLSTAVVVVLGIRIFQNVAAVRRRLVGG